MQKTKVNFDTVYEFETLYNAYRASRRGKRWKNTVAKVEMNALEAIAVLQEELSTGTYRPGGYREYYRRHGSADGWVLKADVHHYFASIRHDILKQDVRELLDDERSLALTDLIIDSTPGNVGIPIGNQSSQVFALLYLNKLDHLMKEGFRFRYYGRYMDDFYIIHESKDTLRAAWKAISEHLAERGLELNDKTQIFPLRNGLDFLGFHSYLTDTGKVVRKLRRASRERMKRKLRKYKVMYESGAITKEKITESYQSWRSHASHGDCHALIQKYDQLYNEIFERSETADVSINQRPAR